MRGCLTVLQGKMSFAAYQFKPVEKKLDQYPQPVSLINIYSPEWK